MRAFRVSVLATACLAAAACATRPAPTDEPGAAQTQQKAAADPVPPPVASELAQAIPAASIRGAQGLRDLCEALRDETRMSFDGNDVATARAQERQRERREAATAARYQTTIGAQGFAFSGYDLAAGQLALVTSSFRLADGVSLYDARSQVNDGSGVGVFALGQEAAERLLQLHADGRLGLHLVFRPAVSELREELCLRQGSGQIVKLGMELEGAFLLGPAGAVLAQHTTEALAETLARHQPVVQPTVTAALPVNPEGGQVPPALAEAAQQLASQLLPCYQARLAENNAVRGKIIVGVKLDAEGRVSAPEMEVSSVGDEALVSCVLSRLASGVRLPAKGIHRLSLPFVFGASGEAG